MVKIGGNISATVQIQTGTAKNSIGERIAAWQTAISPIGWLGLQSGDSKYTHNAKIEESTHIFLCDFNAELYGLSMSDENGKTATVRMIVKGIVYDVLLIDNPDEMNEQLEIYLRRVGAWNG